MGKRQRNREAGKRALLFSPSRLQIRADSIERVVLEGLPSIDPAQDFGDNVVIALLQEAAEAMGDLAAAAKKKRLVTAHILARPVLERLIFTNWLLIEPTENLLRFEQHVMFEEAATLKRLARVGILPAHLKNLDPTQHPAFAGARQAPNVPQMAEMIDKRWAEIEDWPNPGDPTSFHSMTAHVYRITSNGFTHPGGATLLRAKRRPFGGRDEELFWIAPLPVLFYRTLRVVANTKEFLDIAALKELDVALQVSL